MALHPEFPSSPYAALEPAHRWFPADEALRETAYEKLLPPLVASVREEIDAWRRDSYTGASDTTRALLTHWFETEHLLENADGTSHEFQYYFAQREAGKLVFDTFKAAVNALTLHEQGGAPEVEGHLRLTETRPFRTEHRPFVAAKRSVFNRIVGEARGGGLELAFATWLDETKGREEIDVPNKMARLKQWCEDATAADEDGIRYDFVFVDQEGFEKHTPKDFAALVASFLDYK